MATVRSRTHELISAALRALILGAVVSIAVAVASALRAPASTPSTSRAVSGWLAPVPFGWPPSPWEMARHEERWGRVTWELHGDPPHTPTGRANDFAAQWSLQCGWPLPAFSCVRTRLRALWDQGQTFAPPWDGPSNALGEGMVIAAATMGTTEGQFIIPVTPIWIGLTVDTLVWAVPFFMISALSHLRSRMRPGRSTH